MTAIRVVVVDDQELVRTGFAMILENAGLDVVGQGADGTEGVALAARLRPDVVLMDVRMPGIDGIEATRRITADDDGPRVLVLTTFDLDEHVYAAVEAGASGFLLKDVNPDDLAHAVRVVARGEAMLAPALIRRLLERFARPSTSLSAVAASEVSSREGEGAARRTRPVERRDRGGALPQRGNREDVRVAAADPPRPA